MGLLGHIVRHSLVHVVNTNDFDLPARVIPDRVLQSHLLVHWKAILLDPREKNLPARLVIEVSRWTAGIVHWIAGLVHLIHLVHLHVWVLHSWRIDQVRSRIGAVLQKICNHSRLLDHHPARAVLHVWRKLSHLRLVSYHQSSTRHRASTQCVDVATVGDYHAALIDVRCHRVNAFG